MGCVKKMYDFLSVANVCLWSFLKKRKSKFDCYQRDVLVVIGNGPSADKVKYDDIEKPVDYLCVNDFIFTDNFIKIKPQYYCIVDPIYGSVEYGNDDYREYAVDVRKKTIEALERVDWKLILITRRDFNLKISNANISFFYLPPNVCHVQQDNCLKKLIHKMYSKNFLLLGAQNVIVPALFYGIGKGYQKIYVTGLDFSYFDSLIIDKNNHVKNVQSHGSGIKDDVTDWTGLGLIPKGGFYNLLEMYVAALKEFAAIECYSHSMGSTIINTNCESYVDSFVKGEIGEK